MIKFHQFYKFGIKNFLCLLFPLQFFFVAQLKSQDWDSIQIKTGDIVFQISPKNSFSTAIKKATHSNISHCGIVFKDTAGEIYVLEAVQPVRFIPFSDFMSNGEKGKIAIKRLMNADSIWSNAATDSLSSIASQYLGKNYDLKMLWDDSKMYCSELVYKCIYKSTGISVGKLEKFGDFDLSSLAVKQQIQQIHKGKVPYNEVVISPISIYKDIKLYTIFDSINE